MNKQIDQANQKLKSVFEALNEDLMQGSEITPKINSNANDYFPLRVYMSFIKSSEGEEIAICVSIQNRDNQVFIDSDISKDNGEIIINGPSSLLPNIGDVDFELRFSKWLKAFEHFLGDKKHILEIEISKLT